MTRLLSYRRHWTALLLLFFGGVLVGLSFFWAQGFAQVGQRTERSAGLCALAEHQLSAASAAGDGKILLIGGSGVLYGLNAEDLERGLGKPVRNFGLQAALGPRLTLSIARDALKPGDTAILFFEYPSFVYENATESAVSMLLDCRTQDLWAMGPVEANLKLIGVPPSNWLEILSGIAEAEPTSLNSFGDRRMDRFRTLDASEIERRNHYQPVQIRLDSNSDGIRAIAEFKQWADANNVKVLASWPNTIDFDTYQGAAGVKAIKDFYASIDIPLIGDVDLGLYPKELFYDTQYHMNAEGIRLRTQDFQAAARPYL